MATQQQSQDAVTAAREAVVLAPDEPAAHLALADALLAVVPRRIRVRAAALAELDRAELLGADIEEVTRRRDQPKGAGFHVLYWSCFFLFMTFGVNGSAGAAGQAIAWPAMLLVVVGAAAVCRWPPGQSMKVTLDARRKLSRHRMATGDHASRTAPKISATLACLVLPGAFLSIPGVDGDAQPRWAAWAILTALPALGAAVWIGTDRWLQPGTVVRTLRRDAFVAAGITVTFVLAAVAPTLVLLGVRRPGVWLTLFLGLVAWDVVCIVATVSALRRGKAGS